METSLAAQPEDAHGRTAVTAQSAAALFGMSQHVQFMGALGILNVIHGNKSALNMSKSALNGMNLMNAFPGLTETAFPGLMESAFPGLMESAMDGTNTVEAWAAVAQPGTAMILIAQLQDVAGRTAVQAQLIVLCLVTRRRAVLMDASGI